MTTREERFVEAFIKADKFNTIHDIYQKPSTEKVRAHRDCVQRAVEDRACCWAIISHTTEHFTFAYVSMHTDFCILTVETYKSTYEIAIDLYLHEDLYCRLMDSIRES